MSIARLDKAYIELVKTFPLIPLREKKHFQDAVKVMKELAYRRDTLSQGESDYLSVLGDLILQYEKKLPQLDEQMSPREALCFLMDANGLTRKDILEFVGQKSNLSAFLNGHRGLSTRAACRLAEHFKVSPALFLSKD